MNHVLQPIMVCEKTGLEGGITEVRCGSAHSLLLTTAGQVYVWGSNSRGQLGMAHITEVVSLCHYNNSLTCLLNVVCPSQVGITAWCYHSEHICW